MATRKRRKTIIDEGPFLFSEEEMAGKIENVTIIQSPEPQRSEPSSDKISTRDYKVDETFQITAEFSDDHMVSEMEAVLNKMKDMTMSQIRLIALTTTMQGQNGLDLAGTYCVPSISETPVTGYELAAWCYCSFMEAFPQMKDKLQIPYEDHYNKARLRMNA